MSKRVFWGVATAIILAVLASSLLFWAYRSKIASEAEGGREKTWISDVSPASGPGTAPQGIGGDGP